jgi:hypothetical protein
MLWSRLHPSLDPTSLPPPQQHRSQTKGTKKSSEQKAADLVQDP